MKILQADISSSSSFRILKQLVGQKLIAVRKNCFLNVG